MFFLPLSADILAPGELKMLPVSLADSAYQIASKFDRSAQFGAAFFFYRCAIKLRPDASEYRRAYQELVRELYPPSQLSSE